MNKKIIAIAVATVFAAPVSFAATSTVFSASDASLTVGGRAEARMEVKDGKSEDKSRVRLNFKGKVQVNDDLYGIGFYEGEFTTNDRDNDNDTIDNRKTYAGFGGSFGEITYGKNDGALGVLTDVTDIMAYHGAAASYKVAVADRTDNMVAYKGSFDDLALKASYRFADSVEDQVNDEYTDNEQDGYSLSAIYSVGDTGVSVGGGVADQDENNQYILTASYTLNDLYIGLLYEDGEISDADVTAYEVAASYTMDQFVFSTTYGNQEIEDDTSAEAVAIDMTYFFKDNFRTYVSYNFNMLDDGDVIGSDIVSEIDAEDALALGLRYDF